MSAAVTRRANVVLIVTSLLVIAASTVFLIRGFVSAPAPARPTAAAALPTVSADTALPRSRVAAGDGLAARIRARIAKSEQASGLSADQQARLADQAAAIMQTRAGGTFDDYMALMQSWGGECVLSEADLDGLRLGWKPPDHPLALAEYDADALTVSVSDTPETVRVSRGGPGLFNVTTASQFRFAQRWQDLLGGATKQAELTIPTQTNSGDAVEVTYSFFWSASDHRWIPFRLTMVTKAQRPLPMTIF